jgi:iron complex outermembrane receptor protein
MSKIGTLAHAHVAAAWAAAFLLSPACVFAQSASSSATGAQAQSGVDTGPALSEIVVTATRQNELISRVPISVSAYTQQTLDDKGVKSIEDIIRFTPGVTFDDYENHIAIRGISSDAGSGTTGIYIDDTPIQMRNLRYNDDDAVPAIFDLDRVEILRGPQGTLFGAGSEGGTVRYITPQPGLESWSSYARAEGSVTHNGAGSYELGAAVGGPLIDNTLGFRVSAYQRNQGGFVDYADYATGDVTRKNIDYVNTTALDASLAWQPGDGLVVTPAFRYQVRERGEYQPGLFVVGASDISDSQFRTTALPSPSRDEFFLPSLKIQYSAGSFDVISNTSYFRRYDVTGYDGTTFVLGFLQPLLPGCDCPGAAYYPLVAPTGPNPALPRYNTLDVIRNQQNNWTQEIRVQSSDPDARLNWVVGIFYDRAKQSSFETFQDPQANEILGLLFDTNVVGFYGSPLLANNVSGEGYLSETDEQIAGYANLTYRVVSGLKIIGGLRYEDAKFSASTYQNGPLAGGFSGGAGEGTEHPVTPKLGASYDFDRNNLVYTSWSTGFRPGGANPPIPYAPCAQDLANLGLKEGPPSYSSDKVASWEIGSKNKPFENSLAIATSAYLSHWNNIQQSVTLPICQVPFTGNLGAAQVRGFDIQVNAVPIQGLTLDAALGYTHARYTEAVKVSPTATVVESGDSIPVAPWTVSIGAQYNFHLIGDSTYIRGDYQLNTRDTALIPASDPRNTTIYDPGAITPQQIQFVSLRAGFVIRHFDISAFVDNLFDDHPILYQSRTGLLYDDITMRPRTIGVTVTHRL